MKIKATFASILILGLAGCQKDAPDPEPEPTPLTSFSMKVNESHWEPSQVGDNTCLRTFHGAWSALTKDGEEQPFFTILAYKDPRALGNYNSENNLRMQFMNVKGKGAYPILGTYKQEFTSYVAFNVNKPGQPTKHYVNRTDKPNFTIRVEELYRIENAHLKGINGTFQGVLYNEQDLSDSLVVEQGKFSFGKVNWYNFDQCAPENE